MTRLFALVLGLLSLTACATMEPTATSYDRPGFVTEVKDGRLWVFRADSKELADYRKQGEPAQMVTRIGAGPNGMTIRAADAAVIDAYLAAK